MTHLVEVGKRADRVPQVAELFKVDVTIESLSHMTSGKTAPDDIGERWRHMVESLGADERLVGCGQHR